MINAKQPLRLTKREKKAIEQYLKGEITQLHAAKILKLPARQNMYYASDAMLKYLVRTNAIDITKILNNY